MTIRHHLNTVHFITHTLSVKHNVRQERIINVIKCKP